MYRDHKTNLKPSGWAIYMHTYRYLERATVWLNSFTFTWELSFIFIRCVHQYTGRSHSAQHIIAMTQHVHHFESGARDGDAYSSGRPSEGRLPGA